MLRRERDRFELALLGVFVAVCAWTLAYCLWQLAVHGAGWTGVDGIFPGDQLQYLAWIRDASQHALGSDMFVLRPTPHDYLEPVVLVCGLLSAVGYPPWLSYLFLQPFAVLAIFVSVALLCRRMLDARWMRLGALAVALFYGSFYMLWDEWVPFWTWGYMPGALAIAALPAALLALEHTRRTGRRPWLAPLLGLAASWLHPWQGEELIMIVLAAGAFTLRGGERPARALLLVVSLTVLGAAVPLLYYLALDRADPIWRLAEINGALHWPFWLVIRGLLPLAAVACLGWFCRPRSFMDAALRAWPLAALAVYGICQAGLGAGPLHAFAGISIPLAMLAAQGLRRVGLERVPGHRWLTAALVVVATVPASFARMQVVHEYIAPSIGWPNFIAGDEQRALEALDRDPRAGGVVTSYTLGAVVPAATGRRTYVGNCFWSLPDCSGRQTSVQALLEQPLASRAAIAFLGGTGARFLLAPCSTTAPLALELAPIVQQTRSFGCATVYTLRTARAS